MRLEIKMVSLCHPRFPAEACLSVALQIEIAPHGRYT
jgi:hypothetical protein